MPSFSGISHRIDWIYENLYNERCEQRFENLYEVFLALEKAVESQDSGLRLIIDLDRLSELIRSYFIDVIRYKEYHFSPENDVDIFSKEWAEGVHSMNINASKVASLTAKWVLNYKPVGVISKSVPKTPPKTSFIIANINEIFAFQCALLALELEMSEIPPQRVREIVYNLRFRKFEEGLYFLLFSKEVLTAPIEE